MLKMVLQNIALVIFAICFILGISYYLILGKAFSYLKKNYPKVIEKYKLQETSAGGIITNPLKQIKAWNLVIIFIFTNRLKLDDKLKVYNTWVRIILFLVLIGLISILLLVSSS
jgi:hypothetical protein